MGETKNGYSEVRLETTCRRVLHACTGKGNSHGTLVLVVTLKSLITNVTIVAVSTISRYRIPY